MSRLFIAIPLPFEIREHLALLQRDMMTSFRYSTIAWIKPDNFHLTLHFLGDVDEAFIEPLTRELGRLAYPEAFTLRLSAVDAFPNKKNPRTLFVSTTMHPFHMVLRKRTANVLAELGLPFDTKEFHPHITLGRINVRSEVLLPERHDVRPLSFWVDRVILMQSTLAPGGSVYEPLATFPLIRPLA